MTLKCYTKAIFKTKNIIKKKTKITEVLEGIIIPHNKNIAASYNWGDATFKFAQRPEIVFPGDMTFLEKIKQHYLSLKGKQINKQT